MSDRIVIRDLALQCIIGTNPDERVRKQKVVLNIALECDLGPACRSDKLEDTINYKQLKKRIACMVEASSFFLIERLADRAADMCLQEERVGAVTVIVDKPGALTRARGVAVEIRREKGWCRDP